MATKTIRTIFKFRRHNASDWDPNYKLQDGEPGFELDTGKLKIGDGHTTWANLNYLNGVANLTTDGSLNLILNGSEISLSLQNFSSAQTGTSPKKTSNGELEWVKPLNINDVIISEDINAWVEGKIENVTSRVYRGEAGLVTESNGVITILDANYESISNPSVGDVYSYTATESTISQRYLWTGEEWVEIYGQEVYATKPYVQEVLTNALVPATANALGLVKSSSANNQIAVNANGIMSINTISTDKLINAPDSNLILDCGDAD